MNALTGLVLFFAVPIMFGNVVLLVTHLRRKHMEEDKKIVDTGTQWEEEIVREVRRAALDAACQVHHRIAVEGSSGMAPQVVTPTDDEILTTAKRFAQYLEQGA